MPSKLYEMLYDFQKDGVVWMAGLRTGKIGGMYLGVLIIFMFVCFNISILISLNHLMSL
jgi:hypothetical protein